MNYNKAVFENAYGVLSQLPESDEPEVVFAGRSNVGKSSLLNKLFNRKNLARVSSVPGKTITINFYDVDNIIRIGSCGAMVPELDMFDVILCQKVFTEGNYALTLTSENCHIVEPSKILNEKIINTSKEKNQKLIVGNTVCTEVFDEYIIDLNGYKNRIPADFHPISAEMEAFALLYNAYKLGKNASCLMTVVDSTFKKVHATSEEREQGLSKMIELALESI